MKGIVLAVKDNHAAVLTENGDVQKVKAKDYRVGETVILQPRKQANSPLLKLGISAAAVLAFVIVGVLSYFTPSGYVTIDINPSIEYSINIFDRVIAAQAINPAGEDLLALLSVKNKSIDRAVALTTEKLVEQDLISADEANSILITASMPREQKSSALAVRLKHCIQNKLSNNNRDAEVITLTISKTDYEHARELAVSPGKLHLVERLQENAGDPGDINVEEWLNKSAGEINRAIREHKDVPKNGPGNDEPDASGPDNAKPRDNRQKRRER
ncbi:MAG: anti-sigma factor domain-containing protein [Firmicutes bacterium]|nr:anti-sigma factor domain-containing protein [Bacillota bacterium]